MYIVLLVSKRVKKMYYREKVEKCHKTSEGQRLFPFGVSVFHLIIEIDDLNE